MPKDASRRELSKSGSRIEKGALCAELRPFYCSIRILAPMLYMIFDVRPSSSVRRLDRRPSVVVVRRPSVVVVVVRRPSSVLEPSLVAAFGQFTILTFLSIAQLAPR